MTNPYQNKDFPSLNKYKGSGFSKNQQAQVPPEEWQVDTNRSRLYLWTLNDQRQPDKQLWGKLLSTPGIFVDNSHQSHPLLYLDYEIRAKYLLGQDSNASLKASDIDKPFREYVLPDIAFTEDAAARDFTHFLNSIGVTPKHDLYADGNRTFRGDFGGSDSVGIWMSHAKSGMGFECSYIIYSMPEEGHKFWNRYNYFPVEDKVRHYQYLQRESRRSQEDIAKSRLGSVNKNDVVVEISKGAEVGTHMTKEEKEEHERMMRARAAENERLARLYEQHQAANRATLSLTHRQATPLINTSPDHPAHLYFIEKQIHDVVLQKKDIRAIEGETLALYSDGVEPKQQSFIKGAIIPMYDLDGNLGSLQNYYYVNNAQERRRKNAMGTAKKGLQYTFDATNIGRVDVPIVLAEGFSTAASIHAALNQTFDQSGQHLIVPVMVGWDAYNLEPLIEEIKNKYPNTPILIAADNDNAKTYELITADSDKYKSNTGVTVATKLQDANPETVTIMIPSLEGFGERGSADYNDIALKFGLNHLATEIKPHLEQFGIVVNPPNQQIEKPHNTHNLQSNEPESIKSLLVRLYTEGQSPEEHKLVAAEEGFKLRNDMRWTDGNERVSKGIMMPLREITGKVGTYILLTNDQSNNPVIVTPDGFKGLHYPLNVSMDKSNDNAVILAQSYMDGLAIRDAQFEQKGAMPTTLVCFTEQNAMIVAQQILSIQPDKYIVIAPDSRSLLQNKHGASLNTKLDEFAKDNAENVAIMQPNIYQVSVNQEQLTYNELMQKGKSQDISLLLSRTIAEIDKLKKKHNYAPGNS